MSQLRLCPRPKGLLICSVYKSRWSSHAFQPTLLSASRLAHHLHLRGRSHLIETRVGWDLDKKLRLALQINTGIKNISLESRGG